MLPQAYENLGRIGEGTYGVVFKARVKESGELVAIKRFKESDSDEQVRRAGGMRCTQPAPSWSRLLK